MSVEVKIRRCVMLPFIYIGSGVFCQVMKIINHRKFVNLATASLFCLNGCKIADMSDGW
jgi:hypothetical protein